VKPFVLFYKGETFLYLIDYGDEWEFKVEVEEINTDKPLPQIPRNSISSNYNISDSPGLNRKMKNLG